MFSASRILLSLLLVFGILVSVDAGIAPAQDNDTGSDSVDKHEAKIEIDLGTDDLDGDTDRGGVVEVSDDGDTIIVHKHGLFRVESKTTDVVRIGDDIEIEEGETVEGDVVALGGDVTIAGVVLGDVVALGGVLYLESTAEVKGEAVSIGGGIEREDGARVGGESVSLGFNMPGSISIAKKHSRGHDSGGPGLFGKLVLLMLAGLFVFAVMSFWRERVTAMASALPIRLWLYLGLGLLAWLLVLPTFVMLLVFLVISIIGILLVPILVVAVPFAIFFIYIVGMTTVSLYLGERFRGGRYRGRPVAAALVGLVVLHALWILGALLGTIIPFLAPLPQALGVFGKVFVVLATTVGVGCVLHTRFGRRNVPAPPSAESASAEWQPPPTSGGGSAPSPEPPPPPYDPPPPPPPPPPDRPLE